MSQHGVVAIATYVVLAFAFLFGGASRENLLRLALVEIAALPLLSLAVLRLWARPELIKRHRFALGLLAAVVAIPIIQLLPLPPAIWTRLPGREQLVLALELAGVAPGWSPLSMAPDATLRSALALIPPVAVFLAVIVSTYELGRRLIWVCLGATVISIIIGGIQFATQNAALYPWRSTQTGFVVGLFANKNHLATLILFSLPFAALLMGERLRDLNTRFGFVTLAGGAFFGLAVVALAAGQSRTGVVLLLPTLIACLAVAWRAAQAKRPGLLMIGVGGGVLLAVAAVCVLALPRVLERFDNGQEEARFSRWPVALEAAGPYQPVGSGIGSFDPVFRSVEPLSQLDATFFNQAHNEYLETWIEAGWPGIALVIAFIVWWSRRVWGAWITHGDPRNATARAASVAILVVMIHSAGDYPLRTTTMAVLFALACALLDGGGWRMPRRAGELGKGKTKPA